MLDREWRWEELQSERPTELPGGGQFRLRTHSDPAGAPMHVLELSNGSLTFSVLPERGMDIGEILLGGNTMSWDRSASDYLLHPDHVYLQENGGTGWLRGFYGAVAAIGPELFGTPGEGYTLHGTGSYSPAELSSVRVMAGDLGLAVEGRVPVRGYGAHPIFEKTVRLFTRWGSSAVLREETTLNLAERPLVVDDGYHIQLCGPFLHEGGRYVLPVSADSLLLRDSAPPEKEPLRIPALSEGLSPIRCYQFVPKPVSGLGTLPDIGGYVPALRDAGNGGKGLTAEMVVNRGEDAAGFVIRPLAHFPRSLIAKEVADGGFMFALEPCRTRPNRMSQKLTDGEAFILGPGESDTTQCLIGVTDDEPLIRSLVSSIEEAACGSRRDL